MDTVLGIVLLVIGTMVFVMVNKMFNIMYFGAKAIFGTWMACVIATGVVGSIFAAFIITYYKWVIGGLAVIGFLVYMGKRGEKSMQVNEANHTEPVRGKIEPHASPDVPVVDIEITHGENDKFDVVLSSAGANKMTVIAVVREITGLGVVEAKELVDGTPKTVKERVAKADADMLKEKLEQAGANAIIKKATFG